MDQKRPGVLPFMGEAWLAAAARAMRAKVAARRHALEDVRVAWGEVFTSVPPDVGGVGADGVKAWHWTLENGQLRIGEGRPERADVLVTADYAAILPLARATIDESAGDPAVAEIRRALASSGKLRIEGSMDDLPSVLRELLAEVHDELAPLTA